MSYRNPKELPELIKHNGEPVTKEDLHYLYTSGPEKLSIDTIAYLFDVPSMTVFFHMFKYRLGNRVEDSHVFRQASDRHKNKQKEVERKADIEHKKRVAEAEKREWEEAERILGIKKPEIEYVVVDGKRYRDTSTLEAYNQRVRDTITDMRIKSTHSISKSQKEFNTIRHVDLSAMRLHRGLDMFQFAEKAKVPYKYVLYFEKTANVVVPKELSDIYFKVLNISRNEFKKIRDIFAGKRKSMFEEGDRVIPPAVKTYVWKRDGGCCRECGRDKYLHFHHIDRYSNGGKHQARNLKLLCVACHAIEHYGEPGYGMLKAKAEKLGVMVNGNRKTSKECV